MRKLRYMTAALCAVVLLCGMALPAYAFTDESEYEDEEIIVEEAPADEGDEAYSEEYVEESTGGVEWEAVENAPTPLTPSGTGTVIDNVTDADGKEFFTIEAEDGTVFYLVIDRQRSTENVYFLDAVTITDLLSLAGLSMSDAAATPTPEPTPEVAATFEPSVTPIPTAQTGSELALDPQMLMIVGIVALIVIVIAVSVKSRRSKRQYIEQEDYPEEPEPGYDAGGDAPEDDFGFVWDVDE